MRISAGTLREVSVIGVGGFFVASLFGLAQHAYNRKNAAQTLASVETDCIGNDPVISAALHELESRIKDHDDALTHFIKSVDSIDRLLFLRKQFQSGLVEPTPRDVESIFLHYKRCQTEIRKMVQVLTSSMPPRHVADTTLIVDKILELMTVHISTLMGMTNDIH
jgi:hypothetical protein